MTDTDTATLTETSEAPDAPALRLINVLVAPRGSLATPEQQAAWCAPRAMLRYMLRLTLGTDDNADFGGDIRRAAEEAVKPISELKGQIAGELFAEANKLQFRLHECEAQAPRALADADAALALAREELARGDDPSAAEADYRQAIADRDVLLNRVQVLREMYTAARTEAEARLTQALEAKRRELLAEAVAQDEDLSRQLAEAVGAILPRLLVVKGRRLAIEEQSRFDLPLARQVVAGRVEPLGVAQLGGAACPPDGRGPQDTMTTTGVGSRRDDFDGARAARDGFPGTPAPAPEPRPAAGATSTPPLPAHWLRALLAEHGAINGTVVNSLAGRAGLTAKDVQAAREVLKVAATVDDKGRTWLSLPEAAAISPGGSNPV